VTGEGAKLTDKETLRMRLSVFEPTNSQAKIFQEEFINKDFIYIPPSLQERLIKGHWYKWRVEVFDNKGDILATSTRKENEIEIDPEFQIFSEENLLKSLLERYMRIIIRQERSDFISHVILGAIYQSLLLRDEAVREYQKAIEKAPQEAFLYERAIAVLQQQGHVEQAVILKKRLDKAKSLKKH
jgi:tetratricopeptide (TPR) repeat protein